MLCIYWVYDATSKEKPVKKYIYLNLYTEILNFVVYSFVHFDKYIVSFNLHYNQYTEPFLTTKKFPTTVPF